MPKIDDVDIYTCMMTSYDENEQSNYQQKLNI